MSDSRRLPLRIILACANLGILAAGLSAPAGSYWPHITLLVWGIHMLFALVALFYLAPAKGEAKVRAFEVLLVGGFAMWQLWRLPPMDERLGSPTNGE